MMKIPAIKKRFMREIQKKRHQMNFMTQKILPILISRDWEIADMKEYALSCFYVIIVNKKNLEGKSYEI